MEKKKLTHPKRNYDKEYANFMRGNSIPFLPEQQVRLNGFFIKLSKYHKSKSVISSNTSTEQ
jgi:hypothetical protein